MIVNGSQERFGSFAMGWESDFDGNHLVRVFDEAGCTLRIVLLLPFTPEQATCKVDCKFETFVAQCTTPAGCLVRIRAWAAPGGVFAEGKDGISL